MSFLVRPAELEDLEDLYELSSQFVLINLPSNRSALEKKIENSQASFAGKVSKEDGAEFLFVLEDTEKKKVVACSMILAKHGTEDCPHFSFKILKQERTSDDLGIGFIHHVLRLNTVEDGPTEIGALVLDSNYRGRPEKLGKTISMARFLYMGLFPDSFEKNILCEFAPKLTEDGRSLFWEALGRKFTGLSYVEADRLSLGNKEFIKQLFPIEDIYLALLDPEVRMNLGKVSEFTEPAKYLLESIGFKYLLEIDPFDGGPHYGVALEDVSVIRETQNVALSDESLRGEGDFLALVCKPERQSFRALLAKGKVDTQGNLILKEEDKKLLQLSSLDKLSYWKV